jgi:hypothetical protein
MVIFDNNSQAGTPPTGDGSRFPLFYYDSTFGAGVDITNGANITIDATGYARVS